MAFNFETATYGRRAETDYLFSRFDAGKNLLIPGPGRLGKTFVLERLEERSPKKGYAAVRFDASHCRDEKEFFEKLCRAVESKRRIGETILETVKQRLEHLLYNDWEGPEPWYRNALSVNWDTFAEHLVAALAEDAQNRWVLLIDELPVFLLHLETAPGNPAQTANIAYRLRELRERFPKLRWLVTSSVGPEPLVRRGKYAGALNNLEPFELSPLPADAARAFLQDCAAEGYFQHRPEISKDEAAAIVTAAGWPSAYYLEAFGKQVQGPVALDPATARQRAAEARKRLLEPVNRNYFECWPEHLRKHFTEPARSRLFEVLGHLAGSETGLSMDELLPLLADAELPRNDLQRLLNALEADGFVVCDFETDNHRFRMELLRLWWRRYLPD